jgi:lipopolysaccharide/colanic/teichoic acid biosynthesis glycosyltransferase
MKTIIIIRGSDHRWARELFPDRHPLLLPLCNKPAVEYLIDLSVLAGCTEIRIVSDTSLDDVQRICENGTKWGADISYANMQLGESLDRVIEKNRKFCADERVMVISGVLFVRYDRRHDYRSFISSHPSGDVASGGQGRIILTGKPEPSDELRSAPPLSIPDLDTVGHFFRLSREILDIGSDAYVLPGYNNEPDCHIGSNVDIRKGVDIVKPVMIGNNVLILSGAVVGPGSIIGSNTIVGRNSKVVESLVLEGTYIGRRLAVIRRMVHGNLLFEPYSGENFNFEDPHLISGIGQRSKTMNITRRVVHASVALFMIASLAMPYLLFVALLSIRGLRGKKRMLFHSVRPGGTVELKRAIIDAPGLSGAIVRTLSLDRFEMLFQVLVGNLALIGCRPLPVVYEHQSASKTPAGYRPGVFSYAEAENWPENSLDSRMVDHYHLAHGTVFNDITMTLKAFFQSNNNKK